MKWTSGSPPMYVWEGDVWVNEKEGYREYTANLDTLTWDFNNDSLDMPKRIPFPPKTKLMGI